MLVLQGGVIQTGKRHIELKPHKKNEAGKVHITKRHVDKSWSAKSLGADYRRISRCQTFLFFYLILRQNECLFDKLEKYHQILSDQKVIILWIGYVFNIFGAQSPFHRDIQS